MSQTALGEGHRPGHSEWDCALYIGGEFFLRLPFHNISREAALTQSPRDRLERVFAYPRPLHAPPLPVRDHMRKRKVPHLKDIEKLAQDKTAVFFDCFDTLVRRTVYPPDLSILTACESAARELSALIECNAEELFRFRQRVTMGLRLEMGRGDADPEVRLIEIWSETLKRLLGAEHPELARRLCELELNVDISLLEPMPGAAEALETLQASGKRLFVLSDTYYEADQLKKLLESTGLLSYFEEVYSSCTVRRGKYSTGLFSHVLKDKDLESSEVLHVGDHPVSDYKAAGRLGISSFLYWNAAERHRYREMHKRNLGWHFALEGIQADPSQPPLANYNGHEKTLFEIGFRRFGPLFLAFVEDVVRDLQKRGIKKAYFLARDGFVLKRVFDEIVRKENLDLESHYLYVSRSSCAFLDPEDLRRGRLDHPGLQRQGVDLKEFAKLCDVEDLNLLSDPKSYGLSWDRPLRKVRHTDRFKKWVRSFGAEPVVIEAFEEKKRLLAGYLESEGFFSGEHSVAMIDVGWYGTIQRGIGRLMKDRSGMPGMVGYYIGRTDLQTTEAIDDTNEILPGFAFDSAGYDGRPPPPMGVFTILESAAGAPHGSTLGYTDAEGGFKPVLGELKEGELEAQPIRLGAIEYARTYLEQVAFPMPAQSLALASRHRFLTWFYHPPREEAKAIARVDFNLGWFRENETYSIVGSHLGWARFTIRYLRRRLPPETWVFGGLSYFGLPKKIDRFQAFLWRLKRLKNRFKLRRV